MELVKIYPEDMSKKDAFKLMNSNETKRMSDADGSVLDLKAWAIYNDIDNTTGESKKVVTVMTEDGEIFGTVSETFLREFEKIADYFENEIGSIKVISGTSKAGRTFITCDVV